MLGERAATILNVLVGEYLQSATPVASDDIARSLGNKISPATVRNTMSQLTENGFISRPHISSGGVPSDFTDTEWQHGETDGEIFLVIRDGVTADMLGYEDQIPEEDIWHLVNYIKSLAGR